MDNESGIYGQDDRIAMTKNIIILISSYLMMLRTCVLIFTLMILFSASLQINQASATTCTQTAGFTQSQIVMSPSGTILVSPSDTVVNHSDWVEYCGVPPSGTSPFSVITVGTEPPLEFTMTMDSSTGMWYTPTITFSDDAQCTPSVTAKIFCVNVGSTINVTIIFKDSANNIIDTLVPPIPPVQVTDGGNGVDISTYTQWSLYSSQLVACSTNPRVPGGVQGIDTDKDGLCDSWEKNGSIEIKDNRIPGTYTFVCEPGTCKPNKKDLFVEIDYMQGHKPSQMVINHIRDAIASAPVPQITGADPGVDIHIVLDESVPHKDCTSFPGDNSAPGFDQIKSSFYGTGDERAYTVSGYTGNWFHDQGWKLKRYAFHYVLIVDSQCGAQASSGIAEQWGNDAMISLGKSATIDQLEGTILHELGHNLGLDHGGADAVNCKPNELSVMSYSRQFSDMVSDRKLDFSAKAIGSTTSTPPSLDESNLVDADGLNSYSTAEENVIYGPSGYIVRTGSAPIDWDHTSSPTAQLDLNRIALGNSVICDGSNGAAGQTRLFGYNEWSILKFDNRGTSNAYDGRPLTTTASNTPQVHADRPQHNSDCIAYKSVPEKIKKAAQEEYRVCTSGRTLTADEFNLVNAKFVLDNISEMVEADPQMQHDDEIIALINKTDSLIQKDDLSGARGKIADFRNAYGDGMDSNVYQFVDNPTIDNQGGEYTELTLDDVSAMRTIRLNALEKFISDNGMNGYDKQYSDAFKVIRNFINEKDMNSAIYATLDVRKTYDDNTEDNLILIGEGNEVTRQTTLQMTDDILTSFGKAVNDPEIKSFKANPETIITFSKQPPSNGLLNGMITGIIAAGGLAIAVGVRKWSGRTKGDDMSAPTSAPATTPQN